MGRLKFKFLFCKYIIYIIRKFQSCSSRRPWDILGSIPAPPPPPPPPPMGIGLRLGNIRSRKNGHLVLQTQYPHSRFHCLGVWILSIFFHFVSSLSAAYNSHAYPGALAHDWRKYTFTGLQIRARNNELLTEFRFKAITFSMWTCTTSRSCGNTSKAVAGWRSLGFMSFGEGCWVRWCSHKAEDQGRSWAASPAPSSKFRCVMPP